jgi:hypothetical protein
LSILSVNVLTVYEISTGESTINSDGFVHQHETMQHKRSPERNREMSLIEKQKQASTASPIREFIAHNV